MQQSIGALIWMSVRPLISRLWLSAAFGFAITKAHIFPREASRGAGQIVLNVTLPCLMFSKIVPAFTPQNIGNLGPIVAIAFIYEIIGFLFAWGVKQFFWVPHRFRNGILMAGTISNYSDIPTAVITSFTASSPFNPSTDETISVAYVAGFILVFFISLFPMGGHRLVEMDYNGPDVEDSDLRVSPAVKTKESIQRLASFLRRRKAKVPTPSEIEKNEAPSGKASQIPSRNEVEDAQMTELNEKRPAIMSSSSSTNPFQPEAPTAAPSPFPSRVPSPSPFSEATTAAADSAPTAVSTPSPSDNSNNRLVKAPSAAEGLAEAKARSPMRRRILTIAKRAARSFFLPCSVTIIASIVITAVTPLKALFTPVSNSPIPNAPDGQPPLAFILDCATFVGAASVPLGLMCLGSAVARVQLPRSREEWGNLPLGAILAFSVTKMFIIPILGVLIVEGLVHVGFVDPTDKVLRFVCMFISCVPTATSQVYLTQVYSGTGEAGALPLFLVPQYVFMFFSMTILTAYSLSTLFP